MFEIDFDLVLDFVSVFLKNKDIFIRYISKVGYVDFGNEIGWIFDKSIEYYKKYKSMPPQKYFVMEAEKEQNKKLVEVVNNLYNRNVDAESYSVNVISQIIGKVIIESVLRDLENVKDVDVMSSLLYKASIDLKSLDSRMPVWDYADTFLLREEKRKFLMENPQFVKRLKLGIKELDEQIVIEPGMLVGFLAPYKRYKSITLTNVGYVALLQGYSVFHIHYEGRKQMWEARYDSRFTGIDYRRLIDYLRTEDEHKRIQEVYQKISSWKNRLKLAQGIYKKTNALDIKTMIQDIEANEGIRIDVIIVDYANIAGSVRKVSSNDDWQVQEAVAWDLIGLASEPNNERFVITAFQSKSSGVDVESLKRGDFGRSIGIPQALDVAIAINQTEEERREGVLRFSPLLLRDGEIKKSHVKVETELWKMNIAKEIDISFKDKLK